MTAISVLVGDPHYRDDFLEYRIRFNGVLLKDKYILAASEEECSVWRAKRDKNGWVEHNHDSTILLVRERGQVEIIPPSK